MCHLVIFGIRVDDQMKWKESGKLNNFFDSNREMKI